MLNLVSFVGIFGLCFIAWCFSEDRRHIPWKVISWGIGLQLVIGLLVFVVPFTQKLVIVFNDMFNKVIVLSESGTRFLFGPIFVPETPPLSFVEDLKNFPDYLAFLFLGEDIPPSPSATPVLAGRWIARALSAPYVVDVGDRLGAGDLNLGFILAFRVLPQIIFFSAIVGLLYHFKIIQPIVRLFAKLFHRTMNLSGAESLSGAANIFVGIESAVAVKPFLADMTRSELCAILSSCFGSIASTVLALYASLLLPVFPTITGHLMSASIITIPACFVVSKIVVPENGVPVTLGGVPEEPEEDSDAQKKSAMDSLILGALDGVKMAVGIAAVLIAILGLKAMLEYFLGGLFEAFFGALFFIPTFLTGVSFDLGEVWQASVLIGSRLLETSIPPYLSLAQLSVTGEISQRTLLIVSYVLCGFAHIPSVGIFAGGLSSLAPSRSHDISAIVWKALFAATLATLMTGCIAGVFDTGNPSVLGL